MIMVKQLVFLACPKAAPGVHALAPCFIVSV